MPIVSYEVVEVSPNGDRFDALYLFTSSTGETYERRKLVPAGFDHDAYMLSLVPELDRLLAENEVSSFIAICDQGAQAEVTPQHQTQPDYDRRVLGYAMMVQDLVHFWNIYDSIWTPFQQRAGSNKPQRAAYIGVDTQTYDEIDKRMNDMAGISVLILDEKGRMWQDLPDGYW